MQTGIAHVLCRSTDAVTIKAVRMEGPAREGVLRLGDVDCRSARRTLPVVGSSECDSSAEGDRQESQVLHGERRERFSVKNSRGFHPPYILKGVSPSIAL